MLHDILVSAKYNDYLTVNGGTVEGSACNGAAKVTIAHYINKNTPLIKLLSLEDRYTSDWLYIVLKDIVSITVAIYSYVYVFIKLVGTT